MKHILTALLLALAVLVGAMMPGVWLAFQDETLRIPQTIELAEPTLEWNPNKGALQEAEEVTGEVIARRLELFGNSQPVTVPVGTENADDALWATNRAVEFFSMLFETQLEVYDSGAEYQLAWFDDGTTFPFWSAYVIFDQGCVCLLNFDGESGAILQCVINPNGHDLSELFPESFVASAQEPEISFESRVALRFCDALGYFMGRNDGGQNPVELTDEPNCVSITFTDAPEVSATAMLYVDLADGIWFNHP